MKITKISEKKIDQISEILYFIAFSLFLGKAFFDTTTFEIEWPIFFYNNIRLMIVIIIFIRVSCLNLYRFEESIFVACICIIYLMAWRRNGAEIILSSLLLILGGKNISFKKIIKVYLIVVMGLLAVTIAAALCGKIENLVYVQDGRVRQSFGICYPTDFSAHVFFGILGYGYLRKNAMKYWEIFIMVLIGVCVYIFCGARVNTACILLAAVVFFYNKIVNHYYDSRNKKYVMKGRYSTLLAMSPVLCALLMTVFTMLYSPSSKVYRILDGVLNNRLRMGRRGIDLFGFTLFGQSIPMQGNGGNIKESVRYFFLDCSYLSIAIQYGIILLGIVLIIWSIIAFRAKKENDWIFLWIIAITALQCMIEHHMMDLSYNPFLWALLADTVSNNVADELQLEEGII